MLEDDFITQQQQTFDALPVLKHASRGRRKNRPHLWLQTMYSNSSLVTKWYSFPVCSQALIGRVVSDSRSQQVGDHSESNRTESNTVCEIKCPTSGLYNGNKYKCFLFLFHFLFLFSSLFLLYFMFLLFLHVNWILICEMCLV